MRLIVQLLQQKQYFLFRVSSVFLKAYMDQVQDGEDRLFEVTFDKRQITIERKLDFARI
mgnify:FL=1